MATVNDPLSFSGADEGAEACQGLQLSHRLRGINLGLIVRLGVWLLATCNQLVAETGYRWSLSHIDVARQQRHDLVLNWSRRSKAYAQAERDRPGAAVEARNAAMAAKRPGAQAVAAGQLQGGLLRRQLVSERSSGPFSAHPFHRGTDRSAEALRGGPIGRG